MRGLKPAPLLVGHWPAVSISRHSDVLPRRRLCRQHGERPSTVLRLLFQFKLQPQHPLVFGQALFQSLDLVAVADHVLAVAREEVADRLDANLDRAARLILVDVLEAEVGSARVLHDLFDHRVYRRVVAALERRQFERDQVRVARRVLGRPDLATGVFGIGILPGVLNVQRVFDDPRANLVAEQPPEDVVVHRQRIHREDRVAELLELFEDFVVQPRVVVIRPREQHHSESFFGFELIENLARLAAQDHVIKNVERLVTLLDCPGVLFARQTEDVLERLEHLLFEEARLIQVQEGIEISNSVLPEKVAFFGKRGLDRVGRSRHRGAGAIRLGVDQFRRQRVDHREEDQVERLLLVMNVDQVVDVRNAHLRREAGVNRAALRAVLVKLLGRVVRIDQVLRRNAQALEIRRKERIGRILVENPRDADPHRIALFEQFVALRSGARQRDLGRRVGDLRRVEAAPDRLRAELDEVRVGALNRVEPLLDHAHVVDVFDQSPLARVADDQSFAAVKGATPNFVELGAKAVWRSFNPPKVADPPAKIALTGARAKRNELLKKRETMRIGIPRVLNQYSANPLFSAYFESLGVPPQNLIYSDYTTEQLYKDGAKRGAIDPCFPSKVGIPHVHNLIHVHHKKKPLDLIFFPMIDALPSELVNTQSNRACPTVTTTPEAVKAAFTKEGDLFGQNGIRYLDPLLNLDQPRFLEKQMFEAFKDILGLTREENTRAIEEGYKALDIFYNVILRGQAREVLNQLEAEERLGVVLLARPYHNDPGLNHEILEEFQKLGYPVFTMDSLPVDDDILWRLFGDEVRAGIIKHPLDIQDAWKNSYSENTSRKVWAAKYTARHPNLVALELSSFKCGHDAPIYTVVEEVVQNSGTPYFCFKDIDENKPSGSIKIRVETIGYFLTRYREDMIRNRDKVKTLEERLAEYERMLRLQLELEEKAQDGGRSLPVLPTQPSAGQYVGMAAD